MFSLAASCLCGKAGFHCSEDFPPSHSLIHETLTLSPFQLLFGHQVASDSWRPHGLQHARLSFTISWSFRKFMSTELVISSNNLISICKLEVSKSPDRLINVNFTFYSPCVHGEGMCLSWRIQLPQRLCWGGLISFWCFKDPYFLRMARDSLLGGDL